MKTFIDSNNDKISIGIPTLNRPDALKRTLDCLLNQSYKNLEIIISDNCSSDKRVKEIMQNYGAKDPRIVLYFQNENIGIFRNFNFVLEKATGSFFMWKSDDDKIEDLDYISKLYSKLKETDSDFAFPESLYLNSDGSRRSILNSIYSSCKTKFDYLKAATTFSCLEFYGLYNLTKFDKSSELRLNEKLVCPDVLYIPSLFLKHKVVYVPDTYYIYSHESSTDGFRISLNIFRDRQIVMRELISNFASTELLAPFERKEIIENILKYYEAILYQEYSIPAISHIKIKIKNKLKSLFRLGKS